MNEHQKQMIKLFRQLSGKYNLYDVFFDFTKMTAYSISNSFDKIHWEEREEAYLRIEKKYTEEERTIFHQLFAQLVDAMERSPGDVLGGIYMELEISNKDAGQFFTPFHVAKLMAETTFPEKELEIENEGFITAYDSCIGGGVTLIALAEVMRSRGYNYQRQLKIICGDIDANVLSMAYVQFSLLGIDAICERRNALTMEEPSDVWFTPFYALNRARETEEKKSNAALDKMKKVIDMLKKIESPALTKPEQLSLF